MADRVMRGASRRSLDSPQVCSFPGKLPAGLLEPRNSAASQEGPRGSGEASGRPEKGPHPAARMQAHRQGMERSVPRRPPSSAPYAVGGGAQPPHGHYLLAAELPALPSPLVWGGPSLRGPAARSVDSAQRGPITSGSAVKTKVSSAGLMMTLKGTPMSGTGGGERTMGRGGEELPRPPGAELLRTGPRCADPGPADLGVDSPAQLGHAG